MVKSLGVNFLAGNREAVLLHQKQLWQYEKMRITEVQLLTSIMYLDSLQSEMPETSTYLKWKTKKLIIP